MCVCCRCELAPIKTMEKVSFERKNGMQKEVFISTEATAQMSSVYLSGCNVFYTKHLLYSVIRFHFGKSSTLMNINVLFSLSHFFSLSLTQSKSFSMHLYMIILLFFHSHYCLNWNFHLLLFVFFSSLYWACRYVAMACKYFGALDKSILTKDIMDVILQEVTRILFLCVFAIFCFNCTKWQKVHSLQTKKMVKNELNLPQESINTCYASLAKRPKVEKNFFEVYLNHGT